VSGVFNVSVVNMHEDPDNFNANARFVCDHMDNAPHLCEIAKSQSAIYTNQSVDLNRKLFRDQIYLYHSIRLSGSDKRWQQIEAKHNEMTDNIPLPPPQRCLSPEWKNKLLQISLESEIALTPES